MPRQSPRDLDSTRSGRFVNTVSPGNAIHGASVTGYRVGTDGSLTEIMNAPGRRRYQRRSRGIPEPAGHSARWAPASWVASARC